MVAAALFGKTATFGKAPEEGQGRPRQGVMDEKSGGMLHVPWQNSFALHTGYQIRLRGPIRRRQSLQSK
jgi:hypothetical protein